MKKVPFNKISLLLLLVVPVLWTSCEKDDDTTTENVLRYDGQNATAPLLPPGTSEMAVRFTATQTGKFTGQQLEEVTFYVETVPNKCEVVVYDQGGPALPGTPLYTADVTAGLRSGDWNTHTLSTPVEIDGQDLWISIRVTDDAPDRYIGCDSGPGQSNGDWMYLPTDNEWLPFKQRIPTESVNWNIRGIVSE